MHSTMENQLYRIFDGIKLGSLSLVDPLGRERVFGAKNTSPKVRCIIRNQDLPQRVLSQGSIGLGESYMEGWWDVEGNNLVDFFNLIFWNHLERYFQLDLVSKLKTAVHSLCSTPLLKVLAKRDIEKHYDLSNDFFSLFLDRSMTYSCGYQLSPSDSIEQMQEHKYARISKKLGLSKGGRIIDVGCGWGGMLVHAGTKFDVSGVGITLSTNQATFATRKLSDEKLSEKMRIELQDYRDTKGTFDYFVSIGMFEHVGKKSYQTFMRKAHELLAPHGVGLLHTIALSETPKLKPDAWLTKYIFPGARLPRLDELISHMRQNDLLVGHVENLRPHYAETLKKWREKFQSNRERVMALGPQFNQRFIRMWDYYLQICEACFRNTTVELYQVLFCKGPNWNFPMRFDF